AKRREQIIVRIRSGITAAGLRRLVCYKVMFTRNDVLLKIVGAATHHDMHNLFLGLCSHGLDQGLRIPLKASRSRHTRKTSRTEMTAANGRPVGSSKMCTRSMFTMMGASKTKPRGTKRPTSRSKPPTI